MNSTNQPQTSSAKSVRILVAEDSPLNQQVALKQGDNTVDVIAVDKFGNQTRLGLRITRDDSLIEGRYFALLIAVQDYEDPAIPPLAKPIEDAERLAAVLKENYTFEPANVTILRNPDREGILREMMVLRNKLGERDNLLEVVVQQRCGGGAPGHEGAARFPHYRRVFQRSPAQVKGDPAGVHGAETL